MVPIYSGGQVGEVGKLAGTYKKSQTGRWGQEPDGQGEDDIEALYGSQSDDVGLGWVLAD